MLPRKFPKNQWEQRNKATGGEAEEKEKSEGEQCRGKQQLFAWPRQETTYRDNKDVLIVPVKATEKNVCISHNEPTDLEKSIFS